MTEASDSHSRVLMCELLMGRIGQADDLLGALLHLCCRCLVPLKLLLFYQCEGLL